MNLTPPKVEINKIGEYLFSKYGLYFAENRLNDLSNALVQTSEQLKISVNELITNLTSNECDNNILHLLLDNLKISETYFFREQPTLEKICSLILNKSYVDKITIWCAGCSSGEEPYSLLILLLEYGYLISNSSFSLHATDLNNNSIEKAKNGVYSEWSFRKTPYDFRNKYFIQTGNLYKINPMIRRSVNFGTENLFSNPEIFSQDKKNFYDIILCRNVLIYFDDVTREIILNNISYTLKPGGYLFTGLTEIPFVKEKHFKKIIEKEIIFFRKDDSHELINSSESILKNSEYFSFSQRNESKNNQQDEFSINLKNIRELYSSGNYAEVINQVSINMKAVNSISENEKLREIFSMLINSFINLKRTQDAINYCRELLNNNKNEHYFYFLLADLYVHSGNNEAAIDNLTKAIYLKPEYIAAYFLLGNIHQRNNKIDLARKQYNNAISLLKDIPTNSIIEDTGGFSAGSLLNLVNNILERISIIK